MKTPWEKLDKRTRYLAVGGFILAMAVIFGLWLALLPGQLALERIRNGITDPAWNDLKKNGQQVSENWQEAQGEVMDAWERSLEEAIAAEDAANASAAKTAEAAPEPVPASDTASESEQVNAFREQLKSAAADEPQESIEEPQP